MSDKVVRLTTTFTSPTQEAHYEEALETVGVKDANGDGVIEPSEVDGARMSGGYGALTSAAESRGGPQLLEPSEAGALKQKRFGLDGPSGPGEALANANERARKSLFWIKQTNTSLNEMEMVRSPTTWQRATSSMLVLTNQLEGLSPETLDLADPEIVAEMQQTLGEISQRLGAFNQTLEIDGDSSSDVRRAASRLSGLQQNIERFNASPAAQWLDVSFAQVQPTAVPEGLNVNVHIREI